MARILSVSYDEPLLRSRQMLLQEEGHDVVSALGYTEAMKLCKTASGFHVFILGHSIPKPHKEALIAEFRARSSGPVVALTRWAEEPVHGADFHLDPEPRKVVDLVAQITSHKKSD